jgi:hypothetical protein
MAASDLTISVVLPGFLSKLWFWYVLMAIIIVIHFFWGKTPAPKKPNKFFLKHQKGITKSTDIFIIVVASLFSIVLLAFPVRWLCNALTKSEPVHLAYVKFALSTFLVMMTVATGFSGALLGMLSVFQSKLTRTKRVVLLSVCLLPILFSVLSFLAHTSQKPMETVRFCIGVSSASWIVNSPAVFFGVHLFSVAQKILYKLKLIPEESFGNKERA